MLSATIIILIISFFLIFSLAFFPAIYLVNWCKRYRQSSINANTVDKVLNKYWRKLDFEEFISTLYYILT